MTWCYKKRIRSGKCVGVMYAQFTNNKDVYIIALSGSGYKPNIASSGTSELQPTSYHTTWEKLSKNLQQLDVSENVIVAKFDAVHKACLAEYSNGIITNEDFFKKWVQRLGNWIGEWYNQYIQMRKENKKFTIRWLVEKGMESTYLEQMKADAPSEEEALERYKDIVDFVIDCLPADAPSEEEARERYKDIVDFVTDCIPDYKPRDKKLPKNYKLPLRMQMVKLLMTKTPNEIKAWFDKELDSPKLSQCKKKFERLCKEFKGECAKTIKDINVNQFKECLEKVSNDIWTKYKRKYDEFKLPKGYTTVSMIWGGILPDGCKYSSKIVDFFIQCAEDNALCTLVDYVKDYDVKIQDVYWHAFQYTNACREGQCKDSNCKGKECDNSKHQIIETKGLCAFCKVGFPQRASQALKIDYEKIHIEGLGVINDSGVSGDYILNLADTMVSYQMVLSCVTHLKILDVTMTISRRVTEENVKVMVDEVTESESTVYSILTTVVKILEELERLIECQGENVHFTVCFT